MNLPMVIIYKLHKKESSIQPPGEPREQHLGDVRQNKVWAIQKIIKRQNDWKSQSIYIGAFLRSTSSDF